MQTSTLLETWKLQIDYSKMPIYRTLPSCLYLRVLPQCPFLRNSDLMLILNLLLLKPGPSSPSSSPRKLKWWPWLYSQLTVTWLLSEACWHLKTSQQGVRRSWVFMISSEIFSLKFWNFSLRVSQLSLPPHKQTLSSQQK